MRELPREDVEKARIHYQDALDSSRTAEYRNKLGQHATPPELARDIVRCSIPLLPAANPSALWTRPLALELFTRPWK